MKRLYSTSKHKGIILHFADGDTVYVASQCDACQCYQNFYVRIKNIDSYELNSDQSAKAQEIAARYTEKYSGRMVELIPTQRNSDKYGRVVGDLLIDGTLLSTILVENSDAWYVNK